MPISKIKKIVFIHIPKNAGTSITESKSCNFFMNGHYPINEIPSVFFKYFKFSVVRNPWDRIVSSYEYSRMEKSYWHSNDGTTKYKLHVDYHTLKNKSFKECVDMLYHDRNSLKHQSWFPQYYWISNNNPKDIKILVDKIFYYENLNNDYEFNQIVPDLPKINISKRMSIDYRDYYTDDLISKVAEIYKTDIDLFKYNF